MVSSRRQVLLYLRLTLVFSSFFYFLIIRAKHLGAGGGLYVAGIMWCPALPAFATLKLNGRSLSDVGWKWPGTHSALMSWYIPLLYAAIACAIVWLSGLGGFPNQGQGGLMWSSASIQMTTCISSICGGNKRTPQQAWMLF